MNNELFQQTQKSGPLVFHAFMHWHYHNQRLKKLKPSELYSRLRQ